jgi:hypothetical protein
MKLNEYNVIGSAVRLDEIPPAYRRLPFLGRGATTLAFAKDDQTVLLFTRDPIKREWLRDGLKMVKQEKIINPVRSHHIRGMSQMNLMMLEVPRLHALDSANRRKIVAEVKRFREIVSQVRLYPSGNWTQALNQAISIYESENPHSPIAPFLNWLTNYDQSQVVLDMGPRQFKQTYDGNLVLLDPVVSKELYDLLIGKGRKSSPKYW